MRFLLVPILLLATGCTDPIEGEARAVAAIGALPPPDCVVTCDPGPIATTTTNVVISAAAAESFGAIEFVTNSWRIDAAAFLMYPVTIPVGCVLYRWSVRARHASGTPLTAALRVANDGVGTVIGPIQQSSGIGTSTLTGFPNAAIADESDYAIRVSGGAAGDFLFWARVSYACPVN